MGIAPRGQNLRKLPINIFGTNHPRPIKYDEKKGSAQIKSSVMLAALNTPGTTIIRARRSRDHTEKMFKFLSDLDELSLSSGKSININLIKKVLNQ